MPVALGVCAFTVTGISMEGSSPSRLAAAAAIGVAKGAGLYWLGAVATAIALLVLA